MRKQILLNENWKFIKECSGLEELSELQGERIDLPHTWNAADGQDGGNDYYRGVCWYVKELDMPEINEREEVYLEFRGVNSSADIYMNKQHLCRHDGGYSTFRVPVTEVLKEQNQLAAAVDNRKNDSVYPQKADFTFYGGIYRDVYLITVPTEHFSMEYYGSPGIKATPQVKGNRAEVTLEAYTENVPDGSAVLFSLSNGASVRTVVQGQKAKAQIQIEDVRLWDGIEDPYLYTVTAVLESSMDEISVSFGCRTFKMDPKKGFFLNGRSYPLCGAARHQDRQGVGNAVTAAMQDEDMQIIREMGANSVRLAHYQHDQYFYDLCDKNGLIVWTEIPYITEHLPNGQENTITQMTELIVQNYHHPSIVCWGLSNEITASGGTRGEIAENHRILNELCHKLDATRPTVMAHVFMLDIDDLLVSLPDICSYNLYYGWYIGEKEENDQWFDRFHEKHPDMVIGLSEFGADANPAYQSEHPQKGDWSEGYQALYHEHMLKMWSERPFIWAMHVWNMFDFGADGRDEGGKPGQNQKGLVTFDRKLKKDAFYIYKAYLSKEPFVHICGRRYVSRPEETTEIKVYTNQNNITLYVDGNETASKAGEKVFVFSVPINSEHLIEAKSGSVSDRITIRKTTEPDKSYLKDPEQIMNWFDRDDMGEREGYFSIRDSVASIKAVPAAAALLTEISEKAAAAYGDVAKNIKMTESVQKQMDAMPAEAMLRQAGKAVTPEMVVAFNRELNKIKKPAGKS